MECQERNGAALQENLNCDEMEEFLVPDFLSQEQVGTLLEEVDVDTVERLMENFLGFKDTDTDLKEAILVDYFVSGVCWGKEKHFNTQQLTAFLELLHFLMENIKVRRLSLQENIIKMAQAMAVIGRNLSKTTGKMSCFDVEQAKNIITYLNISLFQHYRLYECMFTLPRDQIIVSAQQIGALWKQFSLPAICCYWQPSVHQDLQEEREKSAMYTQNTAAMAAAEQVVEVTKPSETPFPAPPEEAVPFDVYLQMFAPPKPEEEKDEGAEEPREEPTKNTDRAATVLSQATSDARGKLQAKIKEKLTIQEEASTAKIENVKKP